MKWDPTQICDFSHSLHLSFPGDAKKVNKSWAGIKSAHDVPTSVTFLTTRDNLYSRDYGLQFIEILEIQVTYLLLATYSCLQCLLAGVGELDCLDGPQLLSASVSWAPTGGGHTARQPPPSPSHLELTHETHVARRGLAAGRGLCEKRTSSAPLAHAWASPEKLDPAPLFCFLALKMQYWAGSNSIPFYMGLSSICTDGSGPEPAWSLSSLGQ